MRNSCIVAPKVKSYQMLNIFFIRMMCMYMIHSRSIVWVVSCEELDLGSCVTWSSCGPAARSEVKRLSLECPRTFLPLLEDITLRLPFNNTNWTPRHDQDKGKIRVQTPLENTSKSLFASLLSFQSKKCIMTI